MRSAQISKYEFWVIINLGHLSTQTKYFTDHGGETQHTHHHRTVKPFYLNPQIRIVRYTTDTHTHTHNDDMLIHHTIALSWPFRLALGFPVDPTFISATVFARFLIYIYTHLYIHICVFKLKFSKFCLFLKYIAGSIWVRGGCY